MREIVKRYGLRVTLYTALALASFGSLGSSSCASLSPKPTVEDSVELDGAMRGFHRDLRWARYEEASQLVAESYQQAFLGRYEEYGDDLHITLLEVRDVKLERDQVKRAQLAWVEVEQEWYKEPNMTLKKERYMERWEREQQGWRLTERIEKQEWRERERAKKKESAASHLDEAEQ